MITRTACIATDDLGGSLTALAVYDATDAVAIWRGPYGDEIARTPASVSDPGVAVSGLRTALGAAWHVAETCTVTDHEITIFASRLAR
jgi:hypothetical protein